MSESSNNPWAEPNAESSSPQQSGQPWPADSGGQYDQYGQFGQYGQYGAGAQPPPDGQFYGQNSGPYSQTQTAPGPPGGPPPGYGQGGGTYGQYGQYGQTLGTDAIPYGFDAAGTIASEPGIIPLRPLRMSDILEGGFRAIRHNPAVSFFYTALVMAVTFVVQIITTYFSVSAFDIQAGDYYAQTDIIAASSRGTVPLVLVGLLYLLGGALTTGALTSAVSRSSIGHRATIGQVWAMAKGRIWSLFAFSIIMGVIFLIFFTVLMLVMSLLIGSVAIAAFDSPQLMVATIVFFLVVGVAVTVWFASFFIPAIPALVLERIGPFRAISRSFGLIRGSQFRSAATIFVAGIITALLSAAVMTPTLFALSLVVPAGASALIPLAVTLLASAVVACITVPFIAAITTLIYVDLRIRKENLDVELARAAAAINHPQG